MGDPLKGLQDKLYWRQPIAGRVWHCFKKQVHEEGETTHRWASLCDRPGIPRLSRTGGQSIARPPSWFRCPDCDRLEMARREWEEGGPDSADWKDHTFYGLVRIEVVL
jgi:hypothetical protein